MNFPADISSCHEELQRQFQANEYLERELSRSQQEVAKLEVEREREQRVFNQELTYYKEQLKLYRAKLFGRSSERRFPEVSLNQLLRYREERDENNSAKAVRGLNRVTQ